MAARWLLVNDSTTSNVQIDTTLTPGGTWAGVTNQPFGTSRGYAATFGDGTWVVGGEPNKVRTATDVNGTWSAPSSFGDSTSTVWGLAYGQGYFLAALQGTNKAIVRYAADPTGTWSEATNWTGTNAAAEDVDAGNGYFLTCGYVTPFVKYCATVNGTWSSATGVRSAANFRILAGGDGYFVAAGDAASGNYISYTTDPTATWSNASGGFTTGSIRALGWGGGYWVAGGLSGVMRYATSPNSTWGTPSSIGFTSHIFDIQYRDGVWVAIGTTSGGKVDIRTTTDPTGTWTAASTIPSITGGGRGLAVGGGERRIFNIKQSVNRSAVI